MTGGARQLPAVTGPQALKGRKQLAMLRRFSLDEAAVAHNIHHAFPVAGRMAVMRRGEIVADDLSPKTSSARDVEDIITGEELPA